MRAPPASTAAIEPPPAPMVCTSSDGMRIGSPATDRSPAGSGAPPCTRHTSVLVPPMSKVTASGQPLATAEAAAARTPPAGPLSSSAAGIRAPSSRVARPPADVITSTSSATPASPSRYVRQVGRR